MKETTIVSKYGKSYHYVYASQQEPSESFTKDRIDYPQVKLSDKDIEYLSSFGEEYIFFSKEQRTRIYEIISKRRFYFYIGKCNTHKDLILNSVNPQYFKAVQQFFDNLENNKNNNNGN